MGRLYHLEGNAIVGAWPEPIPVAERLPELVNKGTYGTRWSDDVLAFCHGSGWHIAMLYRTGWAVDADGAEVTHWLPMPADPDSFGGEIGP